MLKDLRKLFADNSGDENISKMIWVCIVFTVGAILLLMVTSDGSGLNGKYEAATQVSN